MIDTPITLNTGTVQIQTISPQTGTQGSPNVPAQLAGIPVGSLISGFVINRDRTGNPILRTDRGDVLVKSELFLKTGSEVIIRVQTQAQQTVAKIISVDNIPLQDFINQQQEPVNEDVVLQSPSSTANKLSSGAIPLDEDVQMFQTSTLSAVLLRPPTSTGTASNAPLLASVFNIPLAAATAIEEGGMLQVRVVSSDLGSASLPPPAPAATSASGTATTPATIAPATVAEASPAKATSLATLYQAYQSPALPAANTPPPTNPPISAQPTLPPTPANAALPAMPAIAVNTPSGASIPPTSAAPAVIPTVMPAASAGTSTVSSSGTPTTASPITPTITPTTAAPTASVPTQSPAPPSIIPALTNPVMVGSSAATDLVAKATESAIASAPSHINPQVTLGHKAGIISATVVGHELNGETIVRTSVGSFKLFTPSPPPAGTTLQLQLVALPSPLQANAAAYQNQLLERITAQSAATNSLEELIAIAQTNPALASELAARIPNTKSKLVNNALFFLSALKSGDIRSWLGQGLSDKLEELAPQLLSRLSGELNAARTQAEAPNQPWQPLHFPLLHQNDLDHPKLFIRQDEAGASGKKQHGIRFILDVTFSELGDMQLDGFVRSNTPKTQFDLVVRTHTPLESQMQHDITLLFGQAAELTGFEGTVRFQPDPASFVNAAEANLQARYRDDRSIIA